MRMWMVDPRIMCVRHLTGEHREIHMVVGSVKKKISLTGYLEHNCLEPRSLRSRHDTLVREFNRRGYPAGTEHEPLEPFDISYLPHEEQLFTINEEESRKLLISKCPECHKLWSNSKKEATP